MNEKTAKQLLSEFVRNRDNVQHEAAVLSFLGRLDRMSPTDTMPVQEMLGALAGLVHACLPPQRPTVKPGLQRTMYVDRLGNKHHGVTVSDHIPVIERAH